MRDEEVEVQVRDRTVSGAVQDGEGGTAGVGGGVLALDGGLGWWGGDGSLNKKGGSFVFHH